MREFILTTTIRATPDCIWAVLTDFPRYDRWNSIVISAKGRAVPGKRLDLRIFRPDGRTIRFRPIVLDVSPNRKLLLAAAIFHNFLVRMAHSFTLESKGNGETLLVQRWVVTGTLVPLLWRALKQRMVRYATFGEDLRAVVESRGSRHAEVRTGTHSHRDTRSKRPSGQSA